MTIGARKFVLNGEELQILFTYHAKQRMAESHVSYKQGVRLLLQAEPDKPIHGYRYKKEKYNGNYGVVYFRWGTFIFTGKRVLDKRTGDPTFLVITFTDQRLTVR